MRTILASIVALFSVQPAFASLWCAPEFQGTPSELIAQSLPTLPYQEVQVDLLGSTEIQVDIRDNYLETNPILRLYAMSSASGEPARRIGGVLIGRYETAGSETTGSLDLTSEGRVVLKVSRKDQAPYSFACEIPGDYRKSYRGTERQD